MKPNFKILPHFYVLARSFLAAVAVAVLALSAAHVFAGSEESLPAAMLTKLDPQIVLALKQSRGQPPFDKPTSLEPDIPIKDDAGRVLVDMEASVSGELLNQFALVGGQVINGSVTVTTLRAMVPLSKLETLAVRADVKSISPARPSITSGVKASPGQ